MSKKKRKHFHIAASASKHPSHTQPPLPAAFVEAKARAEGLLDNPAKMEEVIHKAIANAPHMRNSSQERVWKYISIFLRLISAYVHGGYRKAGRSSLVLMTAALVYFVTPGDLIPDMLPNLGHLDDLVIVAYVVATTQKDIDAFLTWEAQQRQASGDR